LNTCGTNTVSELVSMSG